MELVLLFSVHVRVPRRWFHLACFLWWAIKRFLGDGAASHCRSLPLLRVRIFKLRGFRLYGGLLARFSWHFRQDNEGTKRDNLLDGECLCLFFGLFCMVLYENMAATANHILHLFRWENEVPTNSVSIPAIHLLKRSLFVCDVHTSLLLVRPLQ